ncbi:MAG: preprotein translocase subunit SecE [Planctomycetota bacterium]
MKVNIKYQRPGEGTYIRTFFLIYLLLLSARLALSIYTTITAEWWFGPFLGIKVLDEFGFKNGRVIAFLSFIFFSFSSYIFLNMSKVVNFLIETQNELLVVTKPSKKEYLGASIAVLVMVILLSLYLATVDSLFTIIFFQ